MEKERGIILVHVGPDFVGKSASHIVAELMAAQHPVLVTTAVNETKLLLDRLATKPYLLKALPDMPPPKMDSSTPYFNHTKHKQTCLKNRKARKKKKRKK